MKRIHIIYTAVLLFSIQFAYSQNEVDALRYSQVFPVGTAKSMAMGGATGAVGGDFSSLGINPAGIGLYRASEFTFSPSLYWNTTKSEFLGSGYEDDSYDFNLANLGFVLNHSKGNEKGWISTNFGFGYQKINLFSQDVFMRAINNENSYLDNFVYFANMNPSNLSPLYEQLAVDVYLLPYDTVTNEYWNDVQNGGYGEIQQRYISTRGSMGEYLFSFGANYNHQLYIGATLGINTVNYQQTVTHNEWDPDDKFDFFEAFEFEEYLHTRGTGYNLKFGILGRPVEALRIGAAIHLPTFYYLHDAFENSMTAYIDPEESIEPQTAYSGLYEYSYRLRTPFKAIASAAVTIGQVGMISLDYEYIDYRSASLEASGNSFYEENNTINQLYGTASNLRLGGELKLGDIYLRGGYGFYGSPFATGEPNVDSNRNVFSGGIGMRGRFFFIDAGYSVYSQELNYYMYVPQMVEGSLNKSTGNNAQITMGFRF